MNEYEQKKQARIDRYREYADRARAKSSALSRQSTDMADAIPMGQPVHGPADRRYRERIGKKMEQSIAESDKADYYEAKAKAAENNTAISSDAPEAIEKLKEKLDSLQTAQTLMKNVNAYYRKYGTCRGCSGLADNVAEELDQHVKDSPSWVNSPFSSYTLSLNNQEIHRIEDRIRQLRAMHDGGYSGWEFDGGRVEANTDKNRLQIFFDEIPSEEVRTELKSRGFKWARSEGAWQRQLTDNAVYAAGRIEAIRPVDGSDPVKIQPKRSGQRGPTR